MLAKVYSCAVVGLEGLPVEVEVDISNGLPSFLIVGLPDAAVQESKERVRAAVKNSGASFPMKRLTVNLARARPGEIQLDLKAANVSPELPKRIDVVRMQPARLRVLLERVSRKTLPVKVDLVGSPAFGYTVARSPATPSVVEVAGPATAVEELLTIRTEPIDLTGTSQSVVLGPNVGIGVRFGNHFEPCTPTPAIRPF